jgi:ABC-2 type transport system ATP-binding protein
VRAIEVASLTRAFNGVCAVDAVSFAVEEGEVFGFLGPNGAGKTTTIRLLTGQVLPTSGTARVAGCDIVADREQLHSRIGVVFEHQNLYERMSGRENLAFAARLYQVDGVRLDIALQQVGLKGRADDAVRHYSNGMKQRLLIARALLHEPRVLFLDEPTKGLDPAVGRQIRALVANLAAQGMTVFLTTHYMEEADQLCQRVAFLNQGRIVALDAPERLKLAYGRRLVTMVLDSGERVHLSMENRDDGQKLEQLLAEGRILTLHSNEATLEDVFVQLTGRGLLA